MGLSSWLARQAVAGAHALVVEVPGSWTTRVAVEQMMVQRGWQVATSPADADVLIVCGQAGGRLAAAVERTWDQLPGPRARVTAADPDAAGAALDEAEATLLDDHRQREDARQRRTAPDGLSGGAVNEGGSSMAHGGMDHGGTDHGGMDMSGPGGIALASGGPDRDGLAMDVVNMPLGPVLPYWPPGLVLQCALQGDVVTRAEVDVLDPIVAPPVDDSGSHRAARCLDAAADLLTLAGADALAAAARRTRDSILAGARIDAAAAVDRIHHRVARSRTLRWSLRDLGMVDDAVVAEHALPDDTRGDVFDRLLRMVASAGRTLHEGAHHPTIADRSNVIAALPAAVNGLDVAAARLVVASLAPLPVEAGVATGRGGAHA